MSKNANALQASPENEAAAFVYPPRNVAQERDTLYANDALSFDALNHFGWGGTRDLRKGARILIVGEGNGDATVQLAEQARGTPVEIVAIDTSAAAIALSKARLAARGLPNVVHHQLSLLDVPEAELGEFDIIECSHVLDHIETPLDGLAALGAVLKDDGMMVITVNANYGRLQIYMIQALVQHLVTDYMPRDMKIQIVREFLKAVPADHWLGHDSADLIAEIDQADGSGIEALFLQPYNHTFTVGDIYQWLDQCSLALTSFMGASRANYQIETHVQSPKLRQLLAAKPTYERDMIADLMHAGLRTHQFYATIEDKVPAAFADEMVITLAASVASASELMTMIAKTPNSTALLGLIDNKRTIGEIVKQLGEETRDELARLYNTLHLHQCAFLRHKDITPYVSNKEIQARLKSIEPITYQ